MSKKYHIIGVSIAIILSVILGVYVIPNIASDTPQDSPNKNTTQTPNQTHSTVEIQVLNKNTEDMIKNTDDLKVTLYNTNTEQSTVYNDSNITTELEKGEYLLSIEHPYYKNMIDEKITIKDNTEIYELHLEKNKLTVKFSEQITGTVAVDGEEVTVSESSSVEFENLQSGSHTLHIELDNGESLTEKINVSGNTELTIVLENKQ